MIKTTCDLEFDDGIFPAGTECHVYHNYLHRDVADEAESLLLQCKADRLRTGEFRLLVMIIHGRPRLLQREHVLFPPLKPRPAAPVQAEPVTPPAPVKQRSLF